MITATQYIEEMTIRCDDDDPQPPDYWRRVRTGIDGCEELEPKEMRAVLKIRFEQAVGAFVALPSAENFEGMLTAMSSFQFAHHWRSVKKQREVTR